VFGAANLIRIVFRVVYSKSIRYKVDLLDGPKENENGKSECREGDGRSEVFCRFL